MICWDCGSEMMPMARPLANGVRPCWVCWGHRCSRLVMVTTASELETWAEKAARMPWLNLHRFEWELHSPEL